MEMLTKPLETGAPEPFAIRQGLAVYRVGNGEPLFLMPGPHRFQKPGDRTADALISGLVGLGRQVITFDPPASGRSTRPARLGMPEMLQCALESLEACGVNGPVDALGHSMGGLATIAFAVENPRRVKRLILVGTGSGGPAYSKAPGALWNRSHPAFWRMALYGTFYRLWPRLATQQLMMNFIQRCSFYDKSQAMPKAVKPADWLRPRQGRSDWAKIALKLDYRAQLAGLDIPALILCGRHDPQYPATCSEELAACLANSRVIYFDKSGHYPFLEEPELFWEAVGKFLAG